MKRIVKHTITLYIEDDKDEVVSDLFASTLKRFAERPEVVVGRFPFDLMETHTTPAGQTIVLTSAIEQSYEQ